MSSSPRPVCFRCHKPLVTCICSSLPRIENRTRVFVLQHPREHLHPIGTARFARLGLANVHVEVAWNAGVREAEPPRWLPPDVALLYPAESARDLRQVPASEHPRSLLVLDGTWHTARTLYRDKLWLHALPHYRFLPSAPGRYRLRREPQLDYVSTIEAIVEALCILEPDSEGFAQLLTAFDAMIDRQLAYVGTAGPRSRARKRRRPATQRKVPHALVDAFERIVVVYGESSRPRDGQPREFLYFTAVALADGARFEWLLAPASGQPDSEHLRHMGLTAADFAAANGGIAAFRAAWADFLSARGPSPVLAAWNQRTFGLLTLMAGPSGGAGTPVAIKSAYRSVFGIDAHNLEDVVAQRALPLDLNGFRGRAARRLAGAVAVARLLHARAVPESSRTSNAGQTEAHEQSSDRTPAGDAAPSGDGDG